MVSSMTGYGRCDKTSSIGKASVEIKSVNHRYLDLSIKLPKKINNIESDIRSLAKKNINRGKVDVFISYEIENDKDVSVVFHENIALGYLEAAKKAGELGKDLPGFDSYTVSDLLRSPEVISLEESKADEEALFSLIKEAFLDACKAFLESRRIEGENLRNAIEKQLDFIKGLVDKVNERWPGVKEEYKNKISEKTKELLAGSDYEENVLAAEIIIYADKVCVDEETVRLGSHIENMLDTLKLNEPIGRKLDFIAQEMNREANTILSKANDRELSAIAIDLKTEIEKIREQAQNIE